MADESNAFFQSTAFLNGFWVFVGVVPGAFIQHVLASLERRRQARNALKVLKTEIDYNLNEVKALLSHIETLKQKMGANQYVERDLYFPMHKFDYSSFAPLANSGYFHVLLGPQRLKSYLEFKNFFRVESGVNFASMLKSEHEQGRSLAYLGWVEGRARELSSEIERILKSRISYISFSLVDCT